MNVKMRQRVEKMIARRVVLDCLSAGYALNVDNGGDAHELPAPSRKSREVLGVMFATDDEHLVVYERRPDPKHPFDRHMDEWVKVGWVWFVYGNDGYDVVCDHSTNLEPVMRGANELADKYA